MTYWCFPRSILLSLFFVCSVLQAKPVYKVMTEEFNPFGYYQEDGQLTGVAVEITRLLLEAVEHPDNIQVLPWARAIKNIDHKPNHILFAMARTAERETKYQWVGPILSDSIYLFQLANSDIFYQRLEQAISTDFIAVTRDFPEQTFLEDLGFSNLVLTNSPKQSVKLLMTSRVPLMAAGIAVMHDLVKTAGYDPDLVKRTGIRLFSTELYLAFSVNISEKEVEYWQRALDELKQQKKYQDILIKYKFD